MKTVLFLCHGNICRSVGAEFIFNKLIKDKGLENKYVAYSRGLTDDGAGGNIHRLMKQSLVEHNIPCFNHTAKKVSLLDLETSDYVLYMDNENKYLLESEFGWNSKFICLAKYIDQEEITDPWYHRRFDDCFNEIYVAVKNFIETLK